MITINMITMIICKRCRTSDLQLSGEVELQARSKPRGSTQGPTIVLVDLDDDTGDDYDDDGVYFIEFCRFEDICDNLFLPDAFVDEGC